MSYNASIPQPGDQLSQSQPQILGNFTSIGSWVAVNHVTFDSGSATGKHFFVEFPVSGSTPVTVGGEVGLYAQNSTLTSQPELVFSKQNGTSIYEFTSSGQLVNGGWVRHPSGILMKWGTGGPSSAGAYVITFPVNAATPAFASVYTSYFSQTSNTGMYISGLSTTQLTMTVSGSGSFNYLVIGI